MLREWYLKVHNFFKSFIPRDSFIRPFTKQIGTDLYTISRMFIKWENFENELPYSLNIEPTNICNANCIYCAYQFQDRFRVGRGVMSQEIFEKAVRDYKELGGYKWVIFSPISGETLIDPGIINKVRHAKAQGFVVTLYTNGILLKDIDIDALLDTGIDNIHISTPPFDEKSFKLISRTDHYFDLLEGVAKLLETRNRLNSETGVYILFRSNLSYKKVIKLPDFQQKIYPLLSDGEKRAIYECMKIKDFDTWGGIIHKKDLVGIMDVARPPHIKKRPCIWTYSILMLYDGKIRVCGCRFTVRDSASYKDEFILGDITTDSLREVWSSQQLKEIRRRFVKGNLPEVCKFCTMYKPI